MGETLANRKVRGPFPCADSQPFVIVAVSKQHLKSWDTGDPQRGICLFKKGYFEMGHDRDSDNMSTRLTFFLVGAGIGAVLALLFAPKSGEELRNDIADATRKGIDKSREAAQQLGAKANEYYDTARTTAGEYYEATRERASELYDTATAKAGEVASTARDAASRQAGSVQAAFEAGKKAYVEEKRKTELSGRTEAAPTYKPEKTM